MLITVAVIRTGVDSHGIDEYYGIQTPSLLVAKEYMIYQQRINEHAWRQQNSRIGHESS